ncbi:hypothetical protein TNCV_3637461 [Trichonephila clavipes]|nr:hypothetical protein TNCV_3637461 [Trichonephila clavipes]
MAIVHQTATTMKIRSSLDTRCDADKHSLTHCDASGIKMKLIRWRWGEAFPKKKTLVPYRNNHRTCSVEHQYVAFVAKSPNLFAIEHIMDIVGGQILHHPELARIIADLTDQGQQI